MKKKQQTPFIQRVSIDEQIRQAKLHAQRLDIARDAKEWGWLLRACGVNYIWNYVDVAKIEDYLIQFEQELARSQREEVQ